MSTSIHVVPATSADLETGAMTLALAFEDNPWSTWVVPEDDRVERLFELQELYLKHAHAHGRVLVAPATRGVIALLPADAPDPPDKVVDRIIELHGDTVDRLGHSPSLPPIPGAWHVETLGVHPEDRRQGVGSSLLVHALLEIKDLDVPLTLETSDRQNLRLYGRYGFEVRHHVVVPDGPDVWSMVREAPGVAAVPSVPAL